MMLMMMMMVVMIVMMVMFLHEDHVPEIQPVLIKQALKKTSR